MRELNQIEANAATKHDHFESLEMEHTATSLRAYTAAKVVAKTKGHIEEALHELDWYAMHGRQKFEAKMQSLEQESYLEERVGVAIGASVLANASKSSVEYMQEMITEAM